jgi:hypothetical protein
LGDVYASKFDETRITHALEKIVRGLYMYAREKPLPPDTPIRIAGFTQEPQGYRELAYMCSGKGRREGDVFEYRYEISDEAPTHSVWFMLFFRAFLVHATTDPEAWPPSQPCGGS